ncbi:MAG: hypothetical protein AAGA08_02420 [Pseudomonadota bacterium]
MIEFVRTALQARPSWGTVSLVLLFGVAMVGFGNGDRVLWAVTSHGAQLPGVVLDVRSTRGAEDAAVSYIPKVAFRDPSGTVRVMEALTAPMPYRIATDAPVLVAWDSGSTELRIDVPFKRQPATSVILSLLTVLGVLSWLCGICLIGRRIRFATIRMGEAAQNIEPDR